MFGKRGAGSEFNVRFSIRIRNPLSGLQTCAGNIVHVKKRLNSTCTLHAYIIIWITFKGTSPAKCWLTTSTATSYHSRTGGYLTVLVNFSLLVFFFELVFLYLYIYFIMFLISSERHQAGPPRWRGNLSLCPATVSRKHQSVLTKKLLTPCKIRQ